MSSPLDDVCCASLPVEALPALADVRCLAGLEVVSLNGRAWLRWSPGSNQVLSCVLPVPGVVLYAWRDGVWFRAGARLPAFDVPAFTGCQPLSQASDSRAGSTLDAGDIAAGAAGAAPGA